MKTAIIQMHPKPKDIDFNLKKAEKYISTAAKKGAKLIVLPELFNIGYGTISYNSFDFFWSIDQKPTTFF